MHTILIRCLLPRVISAITLLTLTLNASAGEYPKWNFHFPLSTPTTISGSFGEIRTGHFHAGIDFTTDQRTGFPITAIDDGYVIRIAVSPTGYGKALYIAHPNGYTSVYAHCEWFSDKIDAIVTELQYRKKSFALDVYFQPGEIPVKRGELIALSGNTGGSGGPHLHFEVRQTEGERPINGHFFNMPVTDETPPVIEAIRIYPLDKGSTINGSGQPLYIPAVFHDGRYHLKGNPDIKVTGTIGVGVQTIDYAGENWRRNGIYTIKLLVNSAQWFLSRMDGFHFHETRYVNSHIDYAFRQSTGKTIQKSFVDENNRLPIYTTTPERGRIQTQPGKAYDLEYEIADPYGNTSRLSFKMNGVETAPEATNGTDQHLLYIDPLNPYFISIDNFKARFPANSFYTKVPAVFELIPGNGIGIGTYFKVLSEDVPVHNYFDITIPIPNEYKDAKGLTGGSISKGKLNYAGGKIEDGTLRIRTREVGTYCLAIDTVPPTLRVVGAPAGMDYSNNEKISIEIKDDFSGIDSYNCYINGEWMLFDYDLKSNMLNGFFRNLRIKPGVPQVLEVLISDKVGNKSSLTVEFRYK